MAKSPILSQVGLNLARGRSMNAEDISYVLLHRNLCKRKPSSLRMLGSDKPFLLEEESEEWEEWVLVDVLLVSLVARHLLSLLAVLLHLVVLLRIGGHCRRRCQRRFNQRPVASLQVCVVGPPRRRLVVAAGIGCRRRCRLMAFQLHQDSCPRRRRGVSRLLRTGLTY
jgi:hypothetical protein